GGKNSLNRLIRCVCGKKIGPDPRNFNQRVSLGRNDLLIRTFPIINGKKFKTSRAISCRSFNRYFSVSTDYRPKLEALLACSQMLGINQVVAHNGNGGRERIGETGTVLGLNARDSKHAGRMFSMHNCQINPGAGPEITTPWKSYQHEKNRNGLMPLIRRRTMLQL
ncbi:DUF4049 domain-containing protein, partial [Escherichia coli]|uniref:DUF4049 domain-containing protein n=1 Tax=Escherichia coli TaxID=562 RepID=UPI0026664B1D